MKNNLYINFICFFQTSAQRSYTKTYFKNGQLQAEGWLIINQKVDYWFYYYENGKKKKKAIMKTIKTNGGFYESNKVNKK
jgi:antitoxin component YwqK of YwqJK toxin-antitoxin module